jgi:hypothetical protein
MNAIFPSKSGWLMAEALYSHLTTQRLSNQEKSFKNIDLSLNMLSAHYKSEAVWHSLVVSPSHLFFFIR